MLFVLRYIQYLLQYFPNKLHCCLYTDALEYKLWEQSQRKKSILLFWSLTFEFESGATADRNSLLSLFNDYFSELATCHNRRHTVISTCLDRFLGDLQTQRPNKVADFLNYFLLAHPMDTE